MAFSNIDFPTRLAALALALSACTDVGSVFRCKATDCPSGFVCSQPEAKCVRVGVADAAADTAVSCTADKDCTASGPCDAVRCESGTCMHSPLPADVALPDDEQSDGDCRVSICDADGKQTTRPDDTDTPNDDANPCRKHACASGKPDVGSVADGQPCNDGGVCSGGQCSICAGGLECTAPADCTVHLTSCDASGSACVDTGTPIDGKACGSGKVCSSGACVECVIGAACEGSTACRTRHVTSCKPSRVCAVEEHTGTSCGADALGNAMVCNAGECSYACMQATCAAPTDPCQVSRLNCSEPHARGTCVTGPADDGTSCGTDQSCHAGACARTALINGGFTRGLEGWKLTGDAMKFLVAQDANNDQRWSITTWVADAANGGDSATGSVSQQFVVPADAVALRFNIFGGHATVRLQDASGTVLEQVTGPDSNDLRVPVSWDLSLRHGQTVNLIIEDTLTQPNWNFVGVTGFDLIRDVSPLKNAQWDSPVTEGWDLTADAQYWNIFNDYNYGGMGGVDGVGNPAFGRRRGLSSYVRATEAAHMGVAATGTVSQSFAVPADALALRFNVYGGMIGRVTLYDGSAQVEHTNGRNDNATKTPVSWDLTQHRGKTLKLEISDTGATDMWDYVGCSGFDVITSYNGP